jgi:hypothetical protein
MEKNEMSEKTNNMDDKNLNNCIINKEINEINKFIEDSNIMYEYSHPMIIMKEEGYNPHANNSHNTVSTQMKNITVMNKKINTLNILNALKLDKYNDLKLYFDNKYKNMIIKYDTNINLYYYDVINKKESIYPKYNNEFKNNSSSSYNAFIEIKEIEFPNNNSNISYYDRDNKMEEKIMIESINSKLKEKNDIIKEKERISNQNSEFIEVVIYTNCDFIIELKLMNYKILLKDKSHHDYRYLTLNLEYLIDNILYGDKPYFDFNSKHNNVHNLYDSDIIEVNYKNLSTGEEYRYNNNNKECYDEKKLEEFMRNVKKEINPIIMIDYLKTKTIEEMREFLNKIDGYNELSNKMLIIEKDKKIIEKDNEIEKLNKEGKEIKNNLRMLKETTEENLTEINKLRKKYIIIKKKYGDINRMYNNLLGNELVKDDLLEEEIREELLRERIEEIKKEIKEELLEDMREDMIEDEDY